MPHDRYDLVVLGGGTAGLVCAMGAAGLGARVAIVERHLLGGDCLNTGCVPSKALIRSARAAGELRQAAALGVTAATSVDFQAVIARLAARRADLAAHDAAARLASAGAHVFFGEGRFAGADVVQVGGTRLPFRRAVIATGARPAVPPVPGLDAVPVVTNETVFDLRSLPRRLVVIGAGPVGCELAQAFARLGSQVTVIDRAPRVLPADDATAAQVVHECLARDGVRLALGATIERVDADAGGVHVRIAPSGGPGAGSVVAGDVLLVAAGRRANVETLGLEAAGVRADDHGVVVDDRLRTTNRRIFASGDVCSRYRFTHVADATSRLVVQNALFFGRRRASALVVPWVTYTDPEVAHVGVTARDVADSNGRLATVTVPLSAVDRAVVDDEIEGFVAVYHARGRVRGATIVAPRAGEMIAEVTYVMTQGGTLGSLSNTIHPYPTYAAALRTAGDDYRRQSLTPGLRRWLTRYFDWTR